MNRMGYRRGGMRGLGQACCVPPSYVGANQGGTGGVQGGVPSQYGGNAVQGKGINFTYATPLLSTLADSTTAPAQNIQFDANSVFVWLRSTFTANDSAAGGGADLDISTIPVPNISVTIQDTGKGASFMNTPVPVWQIASVNPGLPYILATPQLIQANSVFSWTFTNYDTAASYYNVQFQLHGFRLFNPNVTELGPLFGG
ncbi:MAG: hypothetical protein WBR29_03075 [Gammaproteobacteria bacterium]